MSHTKQRRVKQVYYISIKSNDTTKPYRTYRREGYSQYEVLKRFVRTMPEILHDYYPYKISEPIPVKVKKTITDQRRKIAQERAYEIKVIETIAQRKIDYKRLYGNRWDLELSKLVRDKYPSFAKYFDDNWTLLKDAKEWVYEM